MSRRLQFAAAASLLALAAALPALAAGPIDGQWHGTATREQLYRVGIQEPAVLDKLCGVATGPCVPAGVSFANGRFRFHTQSGASATGTFALLGNHIRLVFATGVGVKPGSIAECNWSVYRDRLTFTRLHGRPCLGWDAAPWTRG